MIQKIQKRQTLQRLLHENGLSLTMFGLFLFCLAGQTVAGHREYNRDQHADGNVQLSFREYLGSGHFVEAVFENWESEFLQMAAYILLTIFLRQKGAPESKKLASEELEDLHPRRFQKKENVPWPVRRGGWALKFYENSLVTALLLLFLISLTLHAIGGAKEYNLDQLQRGAKPVTAVQYVCTSRFWYESFQNWQSEFLSIGMLVVLSIFLRQKGSPQSKPVDHAHHETGS